MHTQYTFIAFLNHVSVYLGWYTGTPEGSGDVEYQQQSSVDQGMGDQDITGFIG
jgi:hypothetical protein